MAKQLAALLLLTQICLAPSGSAHERRASHQATTTTETTTQVYGLPPISTGKVWTRGGVTQTRGFTLPAFNLFEDGSVNLEIVVVNRSVGSDGMAKIWGTAKRYLTGDYSIDTAGAVTILGDAYATFTWEGNEWPIDDNGAIGKALYRNERSMVSRLRVPLYSIQLQILFSDSFDEPCQRPFFQTKRNAVGAGVNCLKVGDY